MGSTPPDSVHFKHHSVFLDIRQPSLVWHGMDTLLEYRAYETYFPVPVLMHDTMALALKLHQEISVGESRHARRPAYARGVTENYPGPTEEGWIYSLDFFSEEDPDSPWFHYKIRRKTFGVEGNLPGTPVSEYLPWQDTMDQFFMCIFPIIDTMPFYAEERCEDITNIKLLNQQDSLFSFTWNTYLFHSKYEFSYAPEGTSPEDGVISACLNSVKTVVDADTGVLYIGVGEQETGGGTIEAWEFLL